ncbi:MAG: S46 family peptidase [Bacteroidota bacterium]
MKHKLLLLLLFVFSLNIFADEGMWIPLLLKQNGNINKMQQLGCKLSAEDIYSVNQSSLKDAIVLFGRGCTGELISDEGLLITNHHCGYGNIQKHSTVENDYLTNGFWAKTKSEELANPGLQVSFLVRMEDVTSKVLNGVTDKMQEAERNKIIADNSSKIEKEAKGDTYYETKVKPFYYGNQYYLFVMEVFKDVRFVGAPPSSIGKFGGDTDNWMWPRHTGDFSLFRIYANKDNKPAEYSADNVPYKPKKSLAINIKGVAKDDFTMVYGFPGSTTEYLTSDAVDITMNIENPIKIALRDKRLEIMRIEMDKSPKVRIQYSNKYAGIANGWKKWIGENRGLKRLDAIEKKKMLEYQFIEWTLANDERKAKYGTVLAELADLYKKLAPLSKEYEYFAEAGWGIEAVKYSSAFRNLIVLSNDKTTTDENLKKESERLKNGAASYFKDYYITIDKEVCVAMLTTYADAMKTSNKPDIFNYITKKYKNNIVKYVDDIYAKSIFVNQEKLTKFLDNYSASKSTKMVNDPIFVLMNSFANYYNANINNQMADIDSKIEILMRKYMQGLMEMEQTKILFPDANSTLRVAYGKVSDYSPVDAVHYDYYTTLDGIIEKENPDIYDYAIPQKLKDLYKTKDYGIYANSDGKMRVCFSAANHTTGGNSGSPVLDAYGNLIGINFDRNWEGTMSDIMYDPNQCRNIVLDIRYALFIIDKLAGAENLIKEMKIIR